MTTLEQLRTETPIPAASRVSPEQLWNWLRDGDEVAVLDVRELRPYSEGHLLVASSTPLSSLELSAPRLVPRRSVRLVVTDADGASEALRGAEVLAGLGYTAVHVLDGGVAAWGAAGYVVFTGTNVLSKAFGEFVEDNYHTPRITVGDLKARLDAGEDLVVVDSRPLDEFHAISIPGGIDAPGAELIYRIQDLVTSPEQPVVVNCAGRTRAIIGAQALINAGLPNPVVSLENGTSAWLVAGYEPERGSTRRAGRPSPEAAAWARQAAAGLAERAGVQFISDAELERIRYDDERSLFLFDVRDPIEYEAGHYPTSLSAPGGQIIQAYDTFVGVHNARIVLVDNPDGVRAIGTAVWLKQVGITDVHVSTTALTTSPLAIGTGPVRLAGALPDVELLTPADIEVLLGRPDVVVVDTGSSRGYVAGHLPGAVHVLRSHLAIRVADVVPADASTVVVTSEDGLVARLAAGDLEGLLAGVRVVALHGGTSGWRASGRALEAGVSAEFDKGADYAGPPTASIDARREHLARYVQWGRQVVAEIERDGLFEFRTLS